MMIRFYMRLLEKWLGKRDIFVKSGMESNSLQHNPDQSSCGWEGGAEEGIERGVRRIIEVI